jgi:HPt (histidine-containing phosphotransfer) domain-containing protein
MPVYGQTALVLQDEAQTIDARFLHFIEDPKDIYDIESIQKLDSERFFQSSSRIPSFALASTSYWVKILIENPSPTPRKFVLIHGYAIVDSLKFYIPEGTGFRTVELGIKNFAKGTEIPYRLPALEFTAYPGRQTLYLKSSNEGMHQFPLEIMSSKVFHSHASKETYKLSFFFGFLAVMALYNFFIGYTTWDKTYFYYVGYIMATFSYYSFSQGHSFVFLNSGLVEWFSKQGIIVSIMGMCCFTGAFSMSFLGLRTRHKAFTWAVYASCLTSLIAFLTSFFNHTLAINLIGKAVSMTSVSVLAAGYFYSYRRFRPAYYFSFAWTIFLVGSISYAFATMGLFPWNDFTRWSLFYGSCFEVVMLSLALGDRVSYMQQKAAREIRKLNDSLERKVEEKTFDIRTLLQSKHSGVMAIAGTDLVIDREYSPYLNEMLEESALEGKKALPLLFGMSDISGDRQSQVEQALLACIGEDMLAFELNADSFPVEMNLNKRNNQTQNIALDWTPVLDARGVITKMLVTCKDITQIKSMMHIVRNQETELTIISQIIQIPIDRFHRFQYSTLNFLEENFRLISTNKNYSSEAMKIIFINIHTIKGSSRTLGLAELAEKSHQLETYLSAIQQAGSSWDQATVLRRHEDLREILQKYVHCNEQKLNRSVRQFEYVQMHRQEAIAFQQRLHEVVKSLTESSARRTLYQMEEDLTLRLNLPLDSVLAENMDNLTKISKDLGKEVPVLSMPGVEGIYLSIEAAEALMHSFVHIMRNAMDHGIETAGERVAMKKKPMGTLEIQAETTSTELCLTIRDDGRGLALRKIQEIAIQQGLMKRGEQRPVNEIAQMIFETGFSTSSRISDISGRGVGMNAVKRYVTQIHGSVEIKILQENPSFADFVPFSLVMTLPSDMFRRISRSSGANHDTLRVV